jgi:pyridoxine 4-dehydrogenase
MLPLQEWALWNGLADCYEQGLVRAVGVSNYGAKELRRVARNFEQRGVPLASAQVGVQLQHGMLRRLWAVLSAWTL